MLRKCWHLPVFFLKQSNRNLHTEELMTHSNTFFFNSEGVTTCSWTSSRWYELKWFINFNLPLFYGRMMSNICILSYWSLHKVTRVIIWILWKRRWHESSPTVAIWFPCTATFGHQVLFSFPTHLHTNNCCLHSEPKIPLPGEVSIRERATPQTQLTSQVNSMRNRFGMRHQQCCTFHYTVSATNSEHLVKILLRRW